MIKLIWFNLKENLRGRIILMLETVALILVVCATLSQLLPFLSARRFHSTLGLRRIIQYSMTPGFSEEDVALNGAVSLGPSYYPKQDSQNPAMTFRCVSPDYFKYIKYEYNQGSAPDAEKNNVTEPAVLAVVTRDLADTYRVGQSYTVKLTDSRDPVTFTVTGVLREERVFLPTATGSNMDLSSKTKNTVFFMENDALAGIFRKSAWHTMWVPDPVTPDAVLSALESNDAIDEIWSGDHTETQTIQIRLEILGPTFILLFAAVGLCFAAYLSHTMLSALSCERKYHIYLICGADRRYINTIHCITEAIPAAGAISLSLLLVVVYNDATSFALRPETFGISVLVALVVYLVSATSGIVQLKRRGNAAEIAGTNK